MNFVLVHGAFHGGWCWSHVAARLRAAGHTVVTPTQTGLGERRHLLSPEITLDTFIDDLCGVLEADELSDAVLVGHSFGGIVISGVADRMPERVRHAVFLDSRILEAGQSMAQVDAARSAEWCALAGATGGIPPVPASYFGLTDPGQLAWVERRLTPHPVGTFLSPLHLENGPVGNGRPCTYLACTDPIYPPLAPCRSWARNRPGWRWAEIATGHDAMVSAPDELAGMLVEIGSSPA